MCFIKDTHRRVKQIFYKLLCYIGMEQIKFTFMRIKRYLQACACADFCLPESFFI